MDDYERRYSAAILEMRAAGLKLERVDRLCLLVGHWFGLRARPSYYRSFLVNFFVNGFYFGIVWGTLMYFLVWRGQNETILRAVLIAAFAGILFGGFMYLSNVWGRKRHGQSAWGDL